MKKINKPPNNTDGVFNEIRKATELYYKFNEQMSGSYSKIQNAFKPITEFKSMMEDPIKNIRKPYERLKEIYRSSLVNEHPLKGILETIDKISKSLKEHTKDISGEILQIARYGWYLEMESYYDLPFKISRYLKENKVDEANKVLANYYKINLDRIFFTLGQRHPERKVIFKAIKKSFIDGNYFVLIPTVLSQVDGITFDFTKKIFFVKDKDNNYLPRVTSILEENLESHLHFYLSPLQNQTPIMAHEKELYKFPCKLNRHRIIHGRSIDYGTEINGLKIISFLKYMSDILSMLNDKIQNEV